MKIEEAIRLMNGYGDAASYTDHRDGQLKKGYVTLKADGEDDVFYLVTAAGSVATMSCETAKPVSVEAGPDAWQDLKGRELKRYSPFRIVSLGHFGLGSGTKKRYEEIRKTAEAAVKKAKAEKRAENPQAEPVRPAFAGNGKDLIFFASNGIQIQMFSGREYERYDESRRFFKKDYLPYAERSSRKKYAYYVAAFWEKQAEALGDGLKAMTEEALAEARAYAGLESSEEIVGAEAGFTL